MPAQFGDIGIQADFRKQGRNFSSQTAFGLVLPSSITQNVPDLFLHAAPMAAGTPLQPRFNIRLDVSNHELGHVISLPISRYHLG